MFLRFSDKVFAIAAASAVGFTALTANPAKALTSAELFPALTRGPGVISTPDTAGSPNSSWGYFFDVTGSQRFVNALGFSAQSTWPTSGLAYTVSLWSYTTDPLNPDPNTATVYTQLASLNFDPSDPNLLLSGTDYWLPLPGRIDLIDDSNPNTGYVVGASGKFTSNPGPVGNGIETGIVGTDVFFSNLIEYSGEGFNRTGFTDYPIPVFASGQPGYWNANVSVDVPGPLPLLGAASAFAWSRRLKRKISHLSR